MSAENDIKTLGLSTYVLVLNPSLRSAQNPQQKPRHIKTIRLLNLNCKKRGKWQVINKLT